MKYSTHIEKAGLEVTLSKDDYRRRVISFAKQLFEGSKDKSFMDEFDQQIYEEFWKEYNKLLNS